MTIFELCNAHDFVLRKENLPLTSRQVLQDALNVVEKAVANVVEEGSNHSQWHHTRPKLFYELEDLGFWRVQLFEAVERLGQFLVHLQKSVLLR